MAKFSEQILRRFPSVFIKRSRSVCRWFHVEGRLLVIFNQFKKIVKKKNLIHQRKKRQKTVSFLLFYFLGDVRDPCPPQCGTKCLSESTLLAQIVGANLLSFEAMHNNW